ncbi:MAG: M1 family metallopeptidase [Candidatus Acidiferrales bacterium]
MRKILLFVALIVALAPFAAAQRLPDLATPENYQLTIAINFDKENFTGDETIAIRVLKPTSTIVLNAAEIAFADATVTSAGKSQSAKVAPDEDKQMATLTFDQPLPAGPATLHIRYTGILNGQLRGLYLSKANGRKYAVSQLENTDARRMYPSFDEPIYKATFDITAIIDKGDTALSNSKVLSDTPGPGEGQHTVKFATTPKMSSYLVALAVGDWQCAEDTADGIPIRICGIPDKKPYADFALRAAVYTVKFYDHYFGIKYPYGKLDILGVSDFSAGAMENTGLIIARDLIFLDPKQSSYLLRKAVAQQLVAHEIAHQWFGDLVTMKWWDDVWLNEGFATWLSFKPMEAWKPEWNLETDAVSSSTGAMGTDSLSSTRAIEAHAETPTEIQELFDNIAYNKAAAVLRMVEGYVGQETFRKGVNAYLSKYSYSNATSEDFWNTIAETSHKPVDRIMSGFVKQPGVPLVSLKTDCAGKNSSVSVSQTRYFRDRSLLEAGSAQRWDIPVCLKAGKNETCELLATQEQQVALPGCSEGAFGNAGGRGYYRSGYTSENFSRIAASAETKLSPPERYMLLDDTLAGLRVSRLQAADFMALAQDLKDDPSTAVMDLLSGYLQYANTYLVNESDRPQFEAWVRSTFGPVAEKMGWQSGPNDSDETRARRGDFLTLMGLVGRDPKAIQFARELMDKSLKGEPVDRTMLIAAIPIASRDGDAALYDAIVAHFPQIKTPEEGLLYGQALCLFSDPALLTRTLKFAVSPMMRAQDAPQVFGSVMANPAGQQVAWDFIRNNWTEVSAKLSNYSDSGLVGDAGVFCDAPKRDEVESFFTSHKVPASDRTLKLTLEQINGCIDLRAHQESNLQSWLQKQAPAKAAGAQ